MMLVVTMATTMLAMTTVMMTICGGSAAGPSYRGHPARACAMSLRGSRARRRRFRLLAKKLGSFFRGVKNHRRHAYDNWLHHSILECRRLNREHMWMRWEDPMEIEDRRKRAELQDTYSESELIAMIE